MLSSKPLRLPWRHCEALRARAQSQAEIAEPQLVMNPIALGEEPKLFKGMKARLRLQLIQSRVFRNGKALLVYEPT